MSTRRFRILFVAGICATGCIVTGCSSLPGQTRFLHSFEEIFLPQDIEERKGDCKFDVTSACTETYGEAVEVSIKFKQGERVCIAGSKDGTSPWAVDDRLKINGRYVDGLKEAYTERGSIPEHAKRPPLDITELFDAGSMKSVEIVREDLGVTRGNTAVFLVIRDSCSG